MPTLPTSLIRCTNAYDINLFLCIHSCRYILDIGLNAFLLNRGREIETKRFVSAPIPTSTHNHVTMSHLFLRVSLGVYSIRKNTIFMLCGQCESESREKIQSRVLVRAGAAAREMLRPGRDEQQPAPLSCLGTSDPRPREPV